MSRYDDVRRVKLTLLFDIVDEYFVGAGDINAGHLPKQDTTASAESTEQESATTSEEAAKNGGGELSSTQGPKSEAPAKPTKPKTPVLDDNDNELENALEVREALFIRIWVGEKSQRLILFSALCLSTRFLKLSTRDSMMPGRISSNISPSTTPMSRYLLFNQVIGEYRYYYAHTPNT